jgi:hypothetical protein
MSRGPGALQRAILDTLDLAKAARLDYLGAQWWETRPDLDRVMVRGYECILAPQVYDMRASLAYLIHQRGLDLWSKAALQAAFARAVKGLVFTGALTVLALVPMLLIAVPYGRTVVPGADDIWELEDGLYLKVSARQRRFVVRAGALANHGER